MKLKVIDMDIATGGVLVAILNHSDAKMLGVHSGDRLKIKSGKGIIVAVADIAVGKGGVGSGCIGLMEESMRKLKPRGSVEVELDAKPLSLIHIKKKLDGKRLNDEEIHRIVQDVVWNKLTDVEITYFVAGTYIHGMKVDEIVALTKAMIDTGEVIKPGCNPVMDKHCIGGVAGNRTTPIVVSILVAAGYCVPKTSSRSITSPAGTADTIEVMANVTLSMEKIKQVVKKAGGCMIWGGSVALAPADERFIRVEHPLSIDAEGQLLSSILAKKGSVSASHVLIDIPVGKGAKIESVRAAILLKKKFSKIGAKVGMNVKAIITDGSEPIGNGLGPALEARDVLRVLKNDSCAPADLRDKCLVLAAEMMQMFPRGRKTEELVDYCREILESGKAFDAMKRIFREQGMRVIDPNKIEVGKLQHHYKAAKKGKVKAISNAAVSRVAKLAGAPADKGAGIYLYKHVGDYVDVGERLMTIYSENKVKLKSAVRVLKKYDGIRI